MFDLKSLVRFFDTGFILRWFFLLLLFSLVPVGEIYLMIRASEIWGIYLVLGVASLTGFIGLFLAYAEVCCRIKSVNRELIAGRDPRVAMKRLAGVIVASVLIILPGFGTDILGFLGFFLPMRQLFGALVLKCLGPRVDSLSEYLRLYELNK